MRNSLCWMPLMLSEHTSTTLWSAHPRIPRLCRSTVPHLPLHPKAILPQPGAPTAIWRGGHVLCFFLFSVLSLHVLLCLMLLSINSERRRKNKRVLGKHSRLPSKNIFLHHYGRIIRYYQGSNPHCDYIYVKFQNIWIIDWLFLFSFDCAALCTTSPCVPPWELLWI